MDPRTDANLVAEALSGSAEPFCALVRRYQGHVYAVAVGILADFDLALDAAQEAFLCAYCDLPTLRDPERFGAWLCGIARNTAFEVRRDRRRQRTLAERAAQRVPNDAAAPSARATAAGNEERSLVREALGRIRETDREALALHYFDGLSYAEICDFLDVSAGTLKGRLQRGRAALRKELAIVKQACKDNAPDDAFARSLARAVAVFAAKGPARDHLPSPWHDSLREETGRILSAGEEGFRIDLALSHSGSARQRHHAAVHFGLRSDDRSLRELERMLDDRSARVRVTALTWYAKRIHPSEPPHPFGAFAPASEAPAAAAKLLERLTDENHNVRLRAVRVSAAYLDAGDPQAPTGLRQAMDDPKHKVRHAAARALGEPCPGCGKTWDHS